MKAVTFNNQNVEKMLGSFFLKKKSFAPSKERHLEHILIFSSMTCAWNYSEMHSKLTAPPG